MIFTKLQSSLACFIFAATAFTSYTVNTPEVLPEATVVPLTFEMEATWHSELPEYDCNSNRGVSYCSQLIVSSQSHRALDPIIGE